MKNKLNNTYADYNENGMTANLTVEDGQCRFAIDWGIIIANLSENLCENKDADQLRGNREADQRPCFR